MENTSTSKQYILFLVICAYIIMISTIIFGLIGQFLHWLLFDSLGRAHRRDRRQITKINNKKTEEYHSIIIGAGFSGLGMAIKLTKLGIDNYILIERHDQVGGTWYANQYPGCQSDVPSNLYSFSFEPNPNWSYSFGRRYEMAEYLKSCTDKYNIHQRIQFNTTVTDLKWIDQQQLWQVTTQSYNQNKKFFYAQFVMVSYAPLSNAAYPTDIIGIDKFEGEMCHTSKWNPTINFKNKRVAVVGTGASAIQVIPEIQKMDISQLIIFQRTPPWIIPRYDGLVSDWEKRLFARFPIIQKFKRALLYWTFESLMLSFGYRSPLRFITQMLVKHNLERQVNDKKFREQLIPTWTFGCKRMLISNDWYSTLQKSNVNLVVNRIREIKSNSIITYDNNEYPVDIIIWSTGFQVQKFLLPISGINGCSLDEQWSETIQAYRGVTVPNFPNLFCLLGPNTGVGHTSVVVMIEAQINYITEAFIYMNKNALRTVAVKKEIHDKFNQQLQLKLKRTVWQTGACHSLYHNAKGINTSLWPDFTWMYILLMKNFDHQNYIFE